MKNFNLPIDYRPYIDKYFLRAKEILQKENLNPMVKAQVFIRLGGCFVKGINEAIEILCKYSDIEKTGQIYSLFEGDYFEPGETLMIIEAPIQTIIDLETMYLGVLSAETTLYNDKKEINLAEVTSNMKKIVDLAGDRPVSYFGARHWRYSYDSAIAMACMLGGAKNCSTDAGAQAWGEGCRGIGTIPHALEAIYHWKYGLEQAVVEATKAFDKYIDKSIPRIALVDYANREIFDSIVTATELGGNLYGIRIDTCGENVMQGAFEEPKVKYWDGTGVTATGVYEVRESLNDCRLKDVKIILSSGFGNPAKVKAFIDFEKEFDTKLFDGLGVGGVFPSRMATMDIIEVEGKEIHKVGRNPKPNDRLRKVF